MRLVAFVAVLLFTVTVVVDGKRSFTIENDRFMRDGQPFNVRQRVKISTTNTEEREGGRERRTREKR
jgi:hypothetical protein